MLNNLIGRKIGPYKIQEKLGSGGMGTVFKAVHIDTRQIVALKVLHEHYSENPKIRLRFEHEAKIASELEHRHIVPMLDFGEFKDYIYLAMPFMEGGNLAAALSEKTLLHYNTSLEMLALLADALDYAHSRGVIHRDFKLENILLDKMGSPSIGDFGIAQSADTTNITTTGQLLGSPLYMAPESFTEAADYRLDLYAFAVTAYLLFTGYFPFTSPNALSILDKHKTAVLPLPSQVNRQLSTELDDIFSKALAKDPDKRFSSARELISQLDRAFAAIPAGATTIFLNEENPLGLLVETPSSIRQGLAATAPPRGSVYKGLMSREYRKFVTPIVLGGVLSACLALSTGAQYLMPNWNIQVNHQLDEFQAGQTLIASQSPELYETEQPTSVNSPTPIIRASSTKPASQSQSEPLSVPTVYLPPVIHDNHRPQPGPASVNNQVIIPTNPPPVNPQPNNPPQPTNPPRNNDGGRGSGNGGDGNSGRGGGGSGGSGDDGGSGRDGGSGGSGDDGGSGRDGGSGGSGDDGGSGRDGGSGGGGRGNGNGNGRGNGRGGS